MNPFEILGQLGRNINLGRNERGWHCRVDGLCWIDGSCEMGNPAFGHTPEAAAWKLIDLIRKPPRGSPALHSRTVDGGVEYRPILLIVETREVPHVP